MTSTLSKHMRPAHSREWSKLRFDWKKHANQSRILSRSGKQMASHICDFCVNKQSGQFFHSNATLAVALGVSERSVQRHLAELLRFGLLRQVRTRGKRRTFQLTLPGVFSDHERDKILGKNTSIPTPQHDKDDASITNQVFNNTKTTASNRLFSAITITDREQDSLNEWHSWISENTGFDSYTVLQRLRTKRGYHLPARYPLGDEQRRATYIEYIKATMTRKVSK